MRCVICDFCEELPLSMLGLSTGHLPDGTHNRIDPRSGLCMVCLYGTEVSQEEEEHTILDGPVPLLDRAWDAF